MEILSNFREITKIMLRKNTKSIFLQSPEKSIASFWITVLLQSFANLQRPTGNNNIVLLKICTSVIPCTPSQTAASSLPGIQVMQLMGSFCWCEGWMHIRIQILSCCTETRKGPEGSGQLCSRQNGLLWYHTCTEAFCIAAERNASAGLLVRIQKHCACLQLRTKGDFIRCCGQERARKSRCFYSHFYLL